MSVAWQRVSLEVKPTVSFARDPLLPVALGTALVLVTYVTPMATVPADRRRPGCGPGRPGLDPQLDVGSDWRPRCSPPESWVTPTADAGCTPPGSVRSAVGAIGCAVAQESVLFVAARGARGRRGSGGARLRPGRPRPRLPTPVRPGCTRPRSGAPASGSASPPERSCPPCWTSDPAGAGPTPWSAWRRSCCSGRPWRGSRESKSANPRRIDVPGLALLVAAMTLLVSALTQGRNGIDVPTVVLAVLAVIAASRFRPRRTAGRLSRSSTRLCFGESAFPRRLARLAHTGAGDHRDGVLRPRPSAQLGLGASAVDGEPPGGGVVGDERGDVST